MVKKDGIDAHSIVVTSLALFDAHTQMRHTAGPDILPEPNFYANVVVRNYMRMIIHRVFCVKHKSAARPMHIQTMIGLPFAQARLERGRMETPPELW